MFSRPRSSPASAPARTIPLPRSSCRGCATNLAGTWCAPPADSLLYRIHILQSYAGPATVLSHVECPYETHARLAYSKDIVGHGAIPETESKHHVHEARAIRTLLKSIVRKLMVLNSPGCSGIVKDESPCGPGLISSMVAAGFSRNEH